MRYTLIFLVFALFATSCEEDAHFIVPEGHSKIFALSEITTSDKIKVHVSTTIGVNTDDEFTFPKQSDAQVTLYENGVPLDNPGFRYISSEGAFISQGSFRPKAGVQYGLGVEMKDETSLKPIYAETTIPNTEEYESVSFRNLVQIDFGPTKKSFTLDAKFSFDEFDHNYFLIRPFWKNENEELVPLQVRPIDKGKEGCIYSAYNDAILVDAYKSQREVGIKIESVDFLDSSGDIDEIELELTAITPEAYNYYKSHSKMVNGQTTVLVEPVITYSNFENGLGLFAGYNASLKSFKVK